MRTAIALVLMTCLPTPDARGQAGKAVERGAASVAGQGIAAIVPHS